MTKLRSLSIIALVFTALACATSGAAGRSSAPGLHSAFLTPSQPIAGISVSFRTQAVDFGGRVPVLPSSTLTDPCTGLSTPVSPLVGWVSQPDSTGTSNQAAFNYTNGIWLAVTPPSMYAPGVAKNGELATVAQFFSDASDPVSLTDGSVAGHEAWVKQLGKIDCGASVAVQAGGFGTSPQIAATNDSTASPAIPSSPGTGAIMFSPQTTGDVMWMENGMILELAGPYAADILEKLASQVTWEPAA